MSGQHFGQKLPGAQRIQAKSRMWGIQAEIRQIRAQRTGAQKRAPRDRPCACCSCRWPTVSLCGNTAFSSSRGDYTAVGSTGGLGNALLPVMPLVTAPGGGDNLLISPATEAY